MLNKTHSTVVAVFRNGGDAQAAANELRQNGFDSSDIFISSGNSTNSPYAQSDTARSEPYRQHEGGITGWFKSLFGESREDTREYNDQPRYENALNSGNVLVSVDVTDENVDRAADALNAHSPIDVHSEDAEATGRETATGTTRGTTAPGRTAAGTTATGAAANAARANTRTEADRTGSIPVVREELQIGKRAVLRGGVRVYSRMVEEPIQENVNLHEERVRVERTPTNRPINDTDLRAGQEQVFEVKEYAEEPVVAKQARVVEEVRVRKDATDRSETVRDTVRHTEVRVENLPEGGRAAGTTAGSARTARDAAATGTTMGTAGTATGTARAAGASADVNDVDFRRHYQQTYGTAGTDYDTYQPAYRYGYEMSGDPRYRGRNFDEIEPQLRDDYSRRYPGSTWDRMKDSVRYGWNKMTNKV